MAPDATGEKSSEKTNGRHYIAFANFIDPKSPS